MREALRVRMFGGFSAAYGGEVLAFGGQKDPKFKQLFQILMTRPGREFSKREVMGSLYDCEAVENANASLNNTIFRLRKYLRNSPLPPGEYLVLKDGMLRFDGGIAVESDAWALECAGRELLDLTAPAEAVRIELNTGVTPAIIVPTDDKDNFLYMVLPVRLKSEG